MLHNRLAKLREERANGEHGFTLIELLVVVVIIGILIAIAIPLYLNYKKGANDKSAQSDVRSAVNTLEQCNTSNSGYPSSLGTLTSNTYPLGASVGCANQTINVTGGTTLTYTAYTATATTPATQIAANVCTTAPCSSYVISGSNSGGTTNKTFTYNSLTGGSISS